MADDALAALRREEMSEGKEEKETRRGKGAKDNRGRCNKQRSHKMIRKKQGKWKKEKRQKERGREGSQPRPRNLPMIFRPFGWKEETDSLLSNLTKKIEIIKIINETEQRKGKGGGEGLERDVKDLAIVLFIMKAVPACSSCTERTRWRC